MNTLHDLCTHVAVKIIKDAGYDLNEYAEAIGSNYNNWYRAVRWGLSPKHYYQLMGWLAMKDREGKTLDEFHAKQTLSKSDVITWLENNVPD